MISDSRVNRSNRAHSSSATISLSLAKPPAITPDKVWVATNIGISRCTLMTTLRAFVSSKGFLLQICPAAPQLLKEVGVLEASQLHNRTGFICAINKRFFLTNNLHLPTRNHLLSANSPRLSKSQTPI